MHITIHYQFLTFTALQEDWLHENEALVDGISFYVKVLQIVPWN